MVPLPTGCSVEGGVGITDRVGPDGGVVGVTCCGGGPAGTKLDASIAAADNASLIDSIVD